jgi:hypothetical protein
MLTLAYPRFLYRVHGNHRFRTAGRILDTVECGVKALFKERDISQWFMQKKEIRRPNLWPACRCHLRHNDKRIPFADLEAHLLKAVPFFSVSRRAKNTQDAQAD